MRGREIKKELLRTGMGFFLFAAGATLINGLFLPFAHEHFGYRKSMVLLSFALAALCFGCLGRWLGTQKEHKLERLARIAVPAYLTILFLAQIYLGYMLEYTPLGDSLMIVAGAELLASEGNLLSNINLELYYARFSNQWGFLMLMTWVLKILSKLGISQYWMVCVVILAALNTGGGVSLFSMAKRFRGARGQLVMIAVLVFCLPVWLIASMVYTDSFSMPFVILALDFALRAAHAENIKKQIGDAALCGLFCTLGGQIKMTVAIVLVAAAIAWVLSMKPLRAVACVMLCLMMLLGASAGIRQMMIPHAVRPEIYKQQHTPAIHWVMMSIPTSDNPYGVNTGDYGITWGMMDNGASKEEVMDSIFTRMKDRIYTLRYPDRLVKAALRKNAAALCDGTFGMTEMLDDKPVRENVISSYVLYGRRHYPLYGAVCTGIYMAHLLMACLGCFRDIRRKDVSLALAYIAMFGMMLFLMLWEARSRYLLGFVPVLLLLSCAMISPSSGRKNDEK